MARDVPPSWRQQFDESLPRLGGQLGAHPTLEPSVDVYLGRFPLEPDDRWGSEMDDLHRAALRAALLRQVAFMSSDLERAAAMCESPPERAMLYALAIVAWEWTDGVLVRVDGSASGLIATRGVYLEIEPQALVGDYRVDFLLTMRLRPATGATRTARMVVECDGHEWHERTRQQAQRDRARDRAIQALDLPVYRYTGSEVWRDVFAAALEAVGELARRFEE
jgi:very-short-patch-repair endonuclease